MNSTLLTYTLAANIGFLLYLLLLRIELGLVGRIFLSGLLCTIPVALLVIVVLPWLLFKPGASFALMFAFFNPIVLAFVIVSKARDVITPRVTAVELACLNVVAPMLASGSFVQYLLNPFINFLPGPAPLRFVLFWGIALTPTWVTIAMLRKGHTNNAGRRMFLVLWTQVIYVLLLLGPAAAAIKDLTTAGASSLVLLSLNGFALMQVALGVISLWSLWKRDLQFMGAPKDRTEFLAERFVQETASVKAILITVIATYAGAYVTGVLDALAGHRTTLLLIAPMIVGMLFLRLAKPVASDDAELGESNSASDLRKATDPISGLWRWRWWIGVAAISLVLIVLWQGQTNRASSSAGEAVAEIVTAEGRLYVGRFLDPKTKKVKRVLNFERRDERGNLVTTGSCYDSEDGTWVDFRMLDTLVAECRWQPPSSQPEEAPQSFVLCDFRATRCFPSVPFGEERDHRSYVGHIKHKQTVFVETDLCSIAIEPPASIRCGDWSEALPDTSQAVALQPRRLLSDPEFIGTHALGYGRQLVCIRAKAEGERESGSLEELHALIIIALDKDMQKAAPIRFVFDDDASCERLVRLSRDALAYVLRQGTSKLLNKGFVVVYKEDELKAPEPNDGANIIR